MQIDDSYMNYIFTIYACVFCFVRSYTMTKDDLILFTITVCIAFPSKYIIITERCTEERPSAE